MRSEWPLPPDSELQAQIEEYYHTSIHERLERYKFVWRKFGPSADMLLVGGIPAMLALYELRLCFIEGHYLACVLLAQTFIEHSLGGAYIMAGDERIAEQGFAKLIDRASADNLIEPELATQLHELRLMRNPYIHPKAGLGTRTYMGRLLEYQRNSSRDMMPEDMTRQDAEYAIQIIVDFMRAGSQNSGYSWEPPLQE